MGRVTDRMNMSAFEVAANDLCGAAADVFGDRGVDGSSGDRRHQAYFHSSSPDCRRIFPAWAFSMQFKNSSETLISVTAVSPTWQHLWSRAIGSVHTRLKQRIGGDVLELRARSAVDVERLRRLLAGLGSADPIANLRWQRVTPPASDPINTLLEAARRIQESGIELEDLGLRRASFEDVLLTLTGGPEAGVAGAPDAARLPQRGGERRQAVV